MRIGLDFDNTIVDYDAVFFQTALDQELVPREIPQTKRGVRDYLRGIDNEDAWTLLQGYVYGTQMSRADLYPGISGFLADCSHAGAEVFIISHKTPHPYMGPAYDLPAAARAFIKEKQLHEFGIPSENVYFEPTMEHKIERIRERECDVFLDDLPEFLTKPTFPEIKRFLFDPKNQHAPPIGVNRVRSWSDFSDAIFHKST